MIKLKKHSESDKAKIITILHILTASSVLDSEYYKIMNYEFKVEDRFLNKYEEVNDDVVFLFFEDLSYRQLYDRWDNGKLPFFEKDFKYSGFLVDEMTSIMRSAKIDGEEKYESLLELAVLCAYLDEFPDKSYIGNSIMEKSKSYVNRRYKKDKIESLLRGVDPLVVAQILDIVGNS